MQRYLSRNWSRWPAISLFVFFAVIAYFRHPEPVWQWQVSLNVSHLDVAPIKKIQPLSHDLTPFEHAVSLAALPSNQMLAVWYGGSAEHHPDVSLYQSSYVGGHFTAPQVIMNRKKLMAKAHRFIHTIGNPVISCQAMTCQLYFVATFGGWSTSRIHQMRSVDGGRHWSAPRLLVTSPIFNISTLLKAHPVSMNKNQWALPVYQELLQKSSMILVVSGKGRVMAMRMVHPSHYSLQPVIVALDNKHAWALTRHAHSTHPAYILKSQTSDGGNHWQLAKHLPFLNPDSAIAATEMNHQIILAFNPGQKNREALNVASFSLKSQKWQMIHQFSASSNINSETRGIHFFSYPDIVPLSEQLFLMAFSTSQGLYYWINHIGE